MSKQTNFPERVPTINKNFTLTFFILILFYLIIERLIYVNFYEKKRNKSHQYDQYSYGMEFEYFYHLFGLFVWSSTLCTISSQTILEIIFDTEDLILVNFYEKQKKSHQFNQSSCDMEFEYYFFPRFLHE